MSFTIIICFTHFQEIQHALSATTYPIEGREKELEQLKAMHARYVELAKVRTMIWLKAMLTPPSVYSLTFVVPHRVYSDSHPAHPYSFSHP